MSQVFGGEVRMGMLLGGKVVNGQLVGGVQYTAEQWDRKLRDDQARRIEAKLDAVMAHLGIELPPQS